MNKFTTLLLLRLPTIPHKYNNYRTRLVKQQNRLGNNNHKYQSTLGMSNSKIYYQYIGLRTYKISKSTDRLKPTIQQYKININLLKLIVMQWRWGPYVCTPGQVAAWRGPTAAWCRPHSWPACESWCAQTRDPANCPIIRSVRQR